MKVYAIGHPNGYVKIGRSIEPSERLSELQPASPYELWLISTIKAKNDEAEILPSVESGIHRYFENVHFRGEWFEIGDDEIHSFGGIKSIRRSILEDVIFKQNARTYSENSTEDATDPGKCGMALDDYLEIARNRTVVA